MSHSEKVIAVVPAYNEARTVGAVVRALAAYVSEVIVVDDCSSDATVAEAEAAGAVVVSNEQNCGYDQTLERGFKEAAKRGAAIIMTFDADGEHDASDVPRVLAPLLAGEADVVAAQRPHTTHFAEKIFALYTGWRYGLHDPLCGFKAYRRSVYGAVGWFDSVSSIGTELTLRAVAKGFRLALVPITLHTRVDDTSRFYARRLRANLKIFKALVRVAVI